MSRFADICGMRILLTAASSAEIEISREWLKKKNNKIGDHEIRSLITGVGLVPTTYSLLKALSDQHPGCILQAGIAGSFTVAQEGKVFVVEEDGFGDWGVIENHEFKTVFDLNLLNRNETPFDGGRLRNPNERLLGLSSLERVHAVSVNEITTDERRIKWLQQIHPKLVESMEGAAFHYVCLLKKIPFIQFRSVSNRIGERNKKKWAIKEALENLNQSLISFFEKISIKDETHIRI